MKKATNYKRAVAQLDNMFNVLNEVFFENQLSKSVITIQRTPSAYGHFSIGKIWKNSDGTMAHEINIGSGTLDRSIEETAATLIHEMTHQYCHEKNIQDTSRGGTYHNKKFKEAAEKDGLITIGYNDRIGHSPTKATLKLMEFCIDRGWEDIKTADCISYGWGSVGTGGSGGNRNPVTGKPIKPKGSNSRKYVCPCCGNSVRATKAVRIACLDCNEEMKVED